MTRPPAAPQTTSWTGGDPRGLLVLVAALTFGMNMVARGFGETFAVFLLPLQDSFGWSRPAMTGVYSVFMLAHGLGAPVAGLLFDKLGPRWLYALGLLLMAAGFSLAAEMTQLWHFYACVGVLVGLGVASVGMVPASGLISRWFARRIGLVMGLAYAAMGAGVLVIVPATQWLLEFQSWSSTYRILGLTLAGLAAVVVLLPLSRLRQGGTAWRDAQSDDRSDAPATWTLGRAARTGAFWGLFNAMLFTAISAYSILPQAVAFLVESGFEPLTASSAFGLTGMLSTVGMVSIGWLSDRFGRRRVVTLSYLCSLTGIASITLIIWHPSLVFMYGFVLFFGIAQGARGPIVSTLAAQMFAGRGIGRIYGSITLALGLGAATGSWVSGLLQDWSGDYLLSFLLGATASVIGLAQFWLVRDLNR
jgi:MFS family permease